MSDVFLKVLKLSSNVSECKPLQRGGAGRAQVRGAHRHHAHPLPGEPVQVDPIKPTLKAPGTKLLKLKYDDPLSNIAFKFKLRRYNQYLHMLNMLLFFFVYSAGAYTRSR